MEIREYNKKQSNRMAPDKYEDEVKKLRKAHERLVKGRFEFNDAQGGWIEFAYRFFKGDMLVVYKLVHGEIVELPAGIIKHINNTKRKVRKFAVNIDPSARGVPSTFEVQSRISFIPVESL